VCVCVYYTHIYMHACAYGMLTHTHTNTHTHTHSKLRKTGRQQLLLAPLEVTEALFHGAIAGSAQEKADMFLQPSAFNLGIMDLDALDVSSHLCMCVYVCVRERNGERRSECVYANVHSFIAYTRTHTDEYMYTHTSTHICT
jgi:hypothetical protein